MKLFVAKLAEGNFNAVWADYALEVTENKALRGAGGTIRLALKEKALIKYFLAKPITETFSTTFQKEACSVVGKRKNSMSHSRTHNMNYSRNHSRN